MKIFVNKRFIEYIENSVGHQSNLFHLYLTENIFSRRKKKKRTEKAKQIKIKYKNGYS